MLSKISDHLKGGNMKRINSTDDTLFESRYIDKSSSQRYMLSSSSDDSLINLIKNGKYIVTTAVPEDINQVKPEIE